MVFKLWVLNLSWNFPNHPVWILHKTDAFCKQLFCEKTSIHKIKFKPSLWFRIYSTNQPALQLARSWGNGPKIPGLRLLKQRERRRGGVSFPQFHLMPSSFPIWWNSTIGRNSVMIQFYSCTLHVLQRIQRITNLFNTLIVSSFTIT